MKKDSTQHIAYYDEPELDPESRRAKNGLDRTHKYGSHKFIKQYCKPCRKGKNAQIKIEYELKNF